MTNLLKSNCGSWTAENPSVKSILKSFGPSRFQPITALSDQSVSCEEKEGGAMGGV